MMALPKPFLLYMCLKYETAAPVKLVKFWLMPGIVLPL